MEDERKLLASGRLDHVSLVLQSPADMESLIASGLNEEQERRYRLARIRRRVEAGLQAAGNLDSSNKESGVSDPVGERFFAAVSDWIQGPTHSQESWREMVRGALEPSMKAQVSKIGGGIFNTDTDEAKNLRSKAIEHAINQTDDLRQRLLSAQNDMDHDRSHSKNQDSESLIAAPWPLSSLLDLLHQKLVASSIIQHAKDIYQHLLTRSNSFEGGFTGKRRFRADPNGRHGSLDLQVEETAGEGWQLGDRVIGNTRLPARRVLFPRDDPGSPAEWSNSTAYVEFEHVDKKTGRQSWHRA